MKTKDNKFLKLIESFSSEEVKEFRRFIASPYITSGRNYIAVLDEVLRQLKSDNGEISLGEMHSRLYPGKRFSAQTLKNRLSELFKIGEEFLIFTYLKTGSFEKDKLLLRALIDRKLSKFFQGSYNRFITRLESSKVDESNLTDYIALQQFDIEHLTMQGKFDRYFSVYYEYSVYHICLSFINIFEIGMEFKQQDFLNMAHDHNFIPDIVSKINFEELLSKSSYKNSDFIKLTLLFYFMYRSYEDISDERVYFEARKLFKELYPRLSDNIKLKLYMMFIYNCTHKRNLGFERFQLELFRLYNEKLESGFYSDFSMNTYPMNNFRDYVLIGLEMKEYEWVENFIEKYSSLLPDTLKQAEVSISYAKLNTSKDNFKDALELLKDVKPANFLHYLDVSLTKLCCYYELGSVEEAFYEIDKLKHYLRNHADVPKIHKTYALNFLRVYTRLLRAFADPSFKEVDQIAGILKTTTKINRHKWLTEKLNNLLARNKTRHLRNHIPA